MHFKYKILNIVKDEKRYTMQSISIRKLGVALLKSNRVVSILLAHITKDKEDI